MFRYFSRPIAFFKRGTIPSRFDWLSPLYYFLFYRFSTQIATTFVGCLNVFQLCAYGHHFYFIIPILELGAHTLSTGLTPFNRAALNMPAMGTADFPVFHIFYRILCAS